MPNYDKETKPERVERNKRNLEILEKAKADLIDNNSGHLPSYPIRTAIDLINNSLKKDEYG